MAGYLIARQLGNVKLVFKTNDFTELAFSSLALEKGWLIYVVCLYTNVKIGRASCRERV